jgi:quercetin dioxygenase-like cupin family protein
MMPVKVNDATINRPEGKRLIDAPAVLVNLNEFIEQLKDESAWQKNDRNGITVFKTSGLTMVLSAFHKGAEIKELQLEGLLVLQVVEGEISVSTDTEEENMKLKEKQILVLHPDAKHKLVAEAETIILLSAIKESGERII